MVNVSIQETRMIVTISYKGVFGTSTGLSELYCIVVMAFKKIDTKHFPETLPLSVTNPIISLTPFSTP